MLALCSFSQRCRRSGNGPLASSSTSWGKCRCRSLGREALVPVMKSSNSRKRNHLSAVGRLDGPSVGRILPERQVRARPVVVGEVGTKNLSEMALVENNDVVQTISPDRADCPFDERILPWASRRRHNLLDAHRLQPRPKLLTVRPVPITHDIPWCRVPRKDLADLLRHPRCGRVCCNTDVLDAPPFVA